MDKVFNPLVKLDDKNLYSKIIINIHSIYSPMRFPYKSMQTVLAITRKILPCPFGGKNLASV